MKSSKILTFSLLLIFSGNIYSQTFDEVLKNIEENNKEIQASNKLVETKTLEYKQAKKIEGPELEYGYFPKNGTVPGAKEVFEVSQSFQMPGYYINQSAYSKLMISQEELSHLVLKQNVLSEAKSFLVEYVYLMKQVFVADKRLKFAEDMHSAYLIRLEVGDVNALEVNKVKLHLLQTKRQENELRTSILAIKESLKNLNGGGDLNLSIDDYPNKSISELDSVLFEKLTIDPELLYNQKVLEASERNIKITKNLQLPNFSLGYGSETVADEKFRGIMVGLSIPLWGSRNAIQKAKLESEYYNLNNISITETRISSTKIQFEKIQSLHENLISYNTVLSSVNSEDLLNKSLEAGEISIIDFFTEMFYYYEIYDDYLIVEKEYHQALAELYKYKL